jgi:8-oxo-dGTP pyrophosphatase MutT (NUDIX family)
MRDADPRLDPVYIYLADHDAAPLARLREHMAMLPGAMFSRKNMTGHITASGLVMTPDGREVLLIHHRGLGKWLQPGGHVDEDDAALWLAAEREIREETGLVDLMLHPWHVEHDGQPADINTHPIPARPEKGEGGHWHHDCLYIFIAGRAPIERQAEEEVSTAVWCTIDDPRVPVQLRRIVDKLRASSAPPVRRTAT